MAQGLLVTCAHVIRAAGGGPGETVRLDFPHVPDARAIEGRGLAEPWCAGSADEAVRKICRAVDRDLTPEERTAYLSGQSVGPGCHPAT